MRLLVFFLPVALLSYYVRAECPNGCSNQGTCGPRDMCTCYKNFQGNDCSEYTCPFGYAHVDTPKGDLDFSGTIDSTAILTNSQVYPYSTYELFNPSAGANEAHFYMECSARGLCDRSNGECQCFPGFSGSSCQRHACLNQCSGHGTCESIAEFASKAGGTLFHTAVDTGATTYKLWDANIGYACYCDPWYFGPDCSQRHCKVGVDPMYEAAGTEILETFYIRATMDTVTNSEVLNAASWIRLRVFDYFGEAYITDRIKVEDDLAANTIVANVMNAIMALPNDQFKAGVTCALASDTATSLRFASSYKLTNHNGMCVVCEFSTNPGKIRLPEIADYFIGQSATVMATTVDVEVTGTMVQGEDTDLCGAIGNSLINDITVGTSAVTVNVVAALTGVATTALIKIKNQYLIKTTDTTAITIAYAWTHADILVTDYVPIYYSSATVTALTETVAAFTVGEKVITMSADPTAAAPVGTLLFYENQFFTVTAVDATAMTITVNRPFGGKAAGGTSTSAATDAIYKIVRSSTGLNEYTYVSECSGRGLCDRGSGTCQCFKGYTSDNCDTQSILSTGG